jgi:hypothetical protein
MDTNISKEPVASTFGVEYDATQEKIECGRGKKSGIGAAGKPMGGCILISAPELPYNQIARENLSSNVCKVCSLQTDKLSYIYSQILEGNGLIFVEMQTLFQ